MQGAQLCKQTDVRSAPKARHCGENVVQHLSRFTLCQTHSSEPRASVYPECSEQVLFRRVVRPARTYSSAGRCLHSTAGVGQPRDCSSPRVRESSCRLLITHRRRCLVFLFEFQIISDSFHVVGDAFLLGYSTKQPEGPCSASTSCTGSCNSVGACKGWAASPVSVQTPRDSRRGNSIGLIKCSSAFAA